MAEIIAGDNTISITMVTHFIIEAVILQAEFIG